METLRDYAIDAALRGWHVFPLRPRGKIPLTTHGYKDATNTPAQVKEWWEQFPDANIGIACGASELLVLDVDGAAGEESIAAVPILLDDPEPFVVSTGKGRHMYFRSNGKSYKNAVAIKPGLDIRTEGGSVVGPGSIHENGNQYRVVRDVPIPPIPPWLEALLESYERDTSIIMSRDKSTDLSTAESIEQGGRIPSGTRNPTLASLAGTMRRRGMSRDEIFAGLLEVNKRRCDPPLAETEVRSIAESIANYAGGLITEIAYKYTDIGNAERFAAKFSKDTRFCAEYKAWFVWDSQRWEEDVIGSIWLKAKDVVRSMYEEAYTLEDPKERETLFNWANQCEKRLMLWAMVDLAKSMLPIRADRFDTNPMLLNCENGTLDLKTGLLQPHNPDDYHSKISPVVWDENAKAPLWDRFLLEIMRGRKELVDYLQRVIGYCLTGDIREQILIVCHGSGSNGKSTLIDTVYAMLGGYARQMAPETIMASTRREAGRATPELAMLAGVRFVGTVETRENQAIDESLTKQLTGGDPITARPLYGRYFQYTPAFKVLMSTNHLPTIKGDDHAIWRRIRKIPFDVRIADEDQDKLLGEKLLTELPGILRWAVAGCLQWQKHGLETPDAVVKATVEYRSSQDVLADFLDECTVEGDGYVTPKKELYDAYTSWCRENGEKDISQRALSTKLQDRGIESKRIHGGIHCWAGILVKNQEDRG